MVGTFAPDLEVAPEAPTLLLIALAQANFPPAMAPPSHPHLHRQYFVAIPKNGFIKCSTSVNQNILPAFLIVCSFH